MLLQERGPRLSSAGGKDRPTFTAIPKKTSQAISDAVSSRCDRKSAASVGGHPGISRVGRLEVAVGRRFFDRFFSTPISNMCLIVNRKAPFGRAPSIANRMVYDPDRSPKSARVAYPSLFHSGSWMTASHAGSRGAVRRRPLEKSRSASSLTTWNPAHPYLALCGPTNAVTRDAGRMVGACQALGGE
jgi:hypothetical protein